MAMTLKTFDVIFIYQLLCFPSLTRKIYLTVHLTISLGGLWKLQCIKVARIPNVFCNKATFSRFWGQPYKPKFDTQSNLSPYSGRITHVKKGLDIQSKNLATKFDAEKWVCFVQYLSLQMKPVFSLRSVGQSELCRSHKTKRRENLILIQINCHKLESAHFKSTVFQLWRKATWSEAQST